MPTGMAGVFQSHSPPKVKHLVAALLAVLLRLFSASPSSVLRELLATS